jgi:hypothetical protein
MTDLFDREIFSCPICCNEFNPTTCPPYCISCGHTLCKACIDKLSSNGSYICPIDKKKILLNTKNKFVKNQFENIVINKLMRILEVSNFDIKLFTEFNFFFCETCDYFISNFVKDVHVTALHNVISFKSFKNKKEENFLNLVKEKKFKEIDENQLMNLNMFVLLRYFYDFNLEKIISNNEHDAPRNEHHFYTAYSFIGHKIKNVEDDLLNYDNIFYLTKFILSHSNFEEDVNLKSFFKKGVYISKNNQVLHGIFLLHTGNVIVRAIGILKDNKNYFFGVINFHFNLQNDLYDLDPTYGIYINDTDFYFGKFFNKLQQFNTEEEFLEQKSHRNISNFTNFNFQSGEITNLKNKQTKRKNKDMIDYMEENLFSNQFFSIDIESQIFQFSKKVFITSLEIENTHTLNYFYIDEESIFKRNKSEGSSDFSNFEEKKIFIQHISIKSLGEELILKPLENFEINEINFIDLKIKDLYLSLTEPFSKPCYIKFNKFQENSIIISTEIVKNDNEKYSGYLFTFNQEEIPTNGKNKIIDANSGNIENIKIFFDLKDFTIKNLNIGDNFNIFVNSISSFLTESPSNVNNLQIFYHTFDSLKNEKQGAYYYLNFQDGEIVFTDPENNIEKTFYSQKMIHLKIHEFLNYICNDDILQIIESLCIEPCKIGQLEAKKNEEEVKLKLLTEINNSFENEMIENKNPHEINLKNQKTGVRLMDNAQSLNNLENKKKISCRCLIF